MNELMTFNFDGATVRTIKGGDGEPRFVAADVCAVLEVANVSHAVSRLDDDEKGIVSSDTPSGAQQMLAVNESGLYSLILGSRKPEAKRFKKWITSEVLPAIRKTGAYTHQPADPLAALKDPATLRGLLLSYSEQVTVLQDRVEALAPKAAALDRISSAEGSVCITEASKMLKVNPRKLFVFMRTEGWIYRRAGGKADLAYQSKLDQGLLEHKPYVYRKDTDYGPQDAVRDQVMVTPKGLAKLAERLEALPLLA